jgi:hypothetical protein
MTSPVVIVRRQINLFIMIAFERHNIDVPNEHDFVDLFRYVGIFPSACKCYYTICLFENELMPYFSLMCCRSLSIITTRMLGKTLHFSL